VLKGNHLQDDMKNNDDTNDNISSTITVDNNTTNTDDTGVRHEHDVFEIQRIQVIILLLFNFRIIFLTLYLTIILLQGKISY
jgi:hypothetical protein